MIPLERLVDWVLGDLDEADEADVDEHLFECDACTTTARRLLAMREATAEIARAGRVRTPMTGALLDRVAADGLPVRTYVVAPGETVPCSADSRQVYAITRLTADLDDVERVAAELIGPGGATLERLDDVPFDRRLGAVVIAETGDAVRAWPTMVFSIRLVATTGDGAERTLGLYTLSHTAG